MWPTPCETDFKGPGNAGDLRDRLDYAVGRGATKSNTYPTPGCKTMGGASGSFAKLHKLVENGTITEEERRNMASGNSGSLNPDWEEWLMCTPVGWTDLDTPNHRLLWLHPTFDPAATTCAASAALPYIPRLTTRRKYRVARVKGIGNMQYPPTAFIMAAWGFAFLQLQLKENT